VELLAAAHEIKEARKAFDEEAIHSTMQIPFIT